METMDHSMAHPFGGAGMRDQLANLPAWKTLLSTSAAVLLGLFFLVAGTWKITDPIDTSVRLTQVQVPANVSLLGAIALGTFETFSAVLLFVPRFRRWGAVLTGLLFIFFMIWIGAYYHVLTGKECSCFPFIKRAVGPGFFAGDALMLGLAGLAYLWSRPSEGKRNAAVILGAVAVFAGVSYGVTAARQAVIHAPPAITVDGKPYSLEQGHIFLYFYDPECLHCDEAARRMAKYNWKDTQLVTIPTRMPQFAAGFLRDTGLRAGTSNDIEKLRKVFSFVDPPYGVALDSGRQKEAFPQFDENTPKAVLKKLGYIE